MRCGRPILLIARLGSAVLLAASCSTQVVAPEAPAPVANSPVNAVKRLEWAINRKDVEAVRALLAADFVFVGAGVDSAGNPSRMELHDRSWFHAALGHLLFFVTRGDSAAIPEEQRGRGAKPDSTRWWLVRLEDETLAGPGRPAATEPSRAITLTTVLEYYFSKLLR